jgi:predicted nucleic acid-binding protein
MNLSVVLDTNVFVAAGFNPHSASARIIEAVRDGRLRLVWTDATRAETSAVLQQIPPLSWQPFADLFRPSDRLTGGVPIGEFADVPDPADRKFAALAAAANAVLVTADDHLLRVRDRTDIEILMPDEYWARYGE